MSSYIEGAVLVIASGKLEIDMAKKAKESLVASGIEILGVVLNKIPMNDSKAYHSYYYYYEESATESV